MERQQTSIQFLNRYQIKKNDNNSLKTNCKARTIVNYKSMTCYNGSQFSLLIRGPFKRSYTLEYNMLAQNAVQQILIIPVKNVLKHHQCPRFRLILQKSFFLFQTLTFEKISNNRRCD